VSGPENLLQLPTEYQLWQPDSLLPVGNNRPLGALPSIPVTWLHSRCYARTVCDTWRCLSMLRHIVYMWGYTGRS